MLLRCSFLHPEIFPVFLSRKNTILDCWNNFNHNNLVSWVLIVLAVIFIIWKLIGGSPTEFSILIALVTSILFKVMSISNDLSALKETVKNLDNKFGDLASDFKVHIKHR